MSILSTWSHQHCLTNRVRQWLVLGLLSCNHLFCSQSGGILGFVKDFLGMAVKFLYLLQVILSSLCVSERKLL